VVLQDTNEEMDLSPSPAPSEAAITSRSLAQLIWQLRWHSDNAEHTEQLFTPLNVWRDLDLCPSALSENYPVKHRGHPQVSF